MRALLAVVAALVPGLVPDDALEPWGSRRQASDVPKKHVEELSAPRQAYAVTQGGTMDGGNCRSPMGVGMSGGPALEQSWESNRAVRMENVGDTDLINPWLSNGRNNFRSLDEIVASAVTPDMSDRDKAMALWFQEIRHRYHGTSGGVNGNGQESGDPVKVFNVYGHNTCGEDSMCLAGLWRKAGLKVAPARLVGHCVSQVFYENRWHVLDGDLHSMYLLRDSETVAGEQDLVRDHDLIKRSHTQGILEADQRGTDEWGSSIYVYEGDVRGDRNCYVSTMNMVLRPGEALTWRWGHVQPVKYRGARPLRFPDTIANGLWEYRPDFSKEAWRKGVESMEAVRAEAGALSAEAGRTGILVWVVRSPYVFLGGKLDVDGSGVRFSVSGDGKAWEDVGTDLDKCFLPDAAPRYEYRLRAQLGPDARLKGLRIVNDVQMAPLALPAMAVGRNEFVYTDQSPGPRKVRITHEWVERSASKPPSAPAAPVFPPEAGEPNGTDIVFRWAPSQDPDGDKVVDYHFELSHRADLKWPLSTNFYKLISKTADRGGAQYTLPGAGFLAPDRTYYWHVRARDEKGLWGPWSKTWSFTPRGPSAPTDLSIELDEKRAVGILRWKPGPAGRAPAKYRVYASDEKGFSVSDAPYTRSVGISKDVPASCPSNFLGESPRAELAVVGRELLLPNANRAFYRVVAVDDRGSRSGPSDYVAAPRPFITSTPMLKAKTGSDYRYPVGVIRSLGDYRMRTVGGRDVTSFWDVESPRFALLRGPAWLKIDEKTGIVSGVPDVAGRVEVTVTAALDSAVRTLDEKGLSWGQEKVLSTTVQPLGTVRQEFVIEVE
jgi:hypothetical protein